MFFILFDIKKPTTDCILKRLQGGLEYVLYNYWAMRSILSNLSRYFSKMETKRFLGRDEAEGEDSLGYCYSSLEEMWALELSSPEIRSKANWYSLGNTYWSGLEPTLATVLGGSDDIHEPDIKESSEFLDYVLSKYSINTNKVLDCGAGIGRVTKYLLIDRFQVVDMLEQCEKFVEYAKIFVQSPKVRNFINAGAQDLITNEKYDVIWVQWVLSQLTDDDLLEFLKKIQSALNDQGLIIFKENIKSKGFIVHKDDFSVTRCEKVLKHAFQASGLQIIEEKLQENWPEDLIRLKMFACIPSKVI
jgi:protein N-terminal methyltransferase